MLRLYLALGAIGIVAAAGWYVLHLKQVNTEQAIAMEQLALIAQKQAEENLRKEKINVERERQNRELSERVARFQREAARLRRTTQQVECDNAPVPADYPGWLLRTYGDAGATDNHP